jgi:hypothetical protein
MKITPSPLVANLRGRAAGAVCALWRGVNYARKYNPSPSNPQSAGQKLTRASLKHLTNIWIHLVTAYKDAWDKFAEGLQMSGFNAFMQANLHDQIADCMLKGSPSNPSVHPIQNLAIAVDADGGTVTWTAGDAVATDKLHILVLKDVHPITPAAVVESDSLPIKSAPEAALVSALTYDLSGVGSGVDALLIAAVEKLSTGELSIGNVKKFTTS